MGLRASLLSGHCSSGWSLFDGREPDRQIESQALSQSQRESGPGRDRRAHHRSHKSYTLTAVRSESGDKGSQCSASRRLRGEPEYQNEDATHAAMRATDQTGS
jgi:hypothetical protein